MVLTSKTAEFEAMQPTTRTFWPESNKHRLVKFHQTKVVQRILQNEDPAQNTAESEEPLA